MNEEVQGILNELAERNNQRIDAMGEAVAKMRDDAVRRRRESGIENQWQEDEEYYQGEDEISRSGGSYTKSTSTEGGLIGDTRKHKVNRTTEFFSLTRQFCDSAIARIGDIVCPTGDWNFKLQATPVPSIVEHKENKEPVQDSEGNPVMRETGEPATVADFAKEELDKAAKSAKKAGQYIFDWLTEGHYHSEQHRLIADCVISGTGCVKGPVAEIRKRKRVTKSGGKVLVEIVEKEVPVSKRVSKWDCFPDPDCGENIHDGSFFLERDRMSKTKLEALKKLPGYLADRIDKVIEEGPGKQNAERQRDHRGRFAKADKNKLFDVWYFYGEIESEDLGMIYQITGTKDPRTEKERTNKTIPAIVTMVNDTPIKAVCSHIMSGEFPYDFLTWQTIEGEPWGIGLARIGRPAAKFYCASARTLIDNAGLSAANMLVVNRNMVEPVDGKWDIHARKVWITTELAQQADVRNAFMFVDIPSRQVELTACIQLAKQMMEEATGIFFLMQGDQGAAPDTVGGMQLLHNNSSAVLRQFARKYDEQITEPHISRYYYDWLMVDDNIPEDCKIEMDIDAIGSAVLVERALQEMQVTNLAVMALNPAYKWDPEKAGEQVLKALRFDPEGFKMDPEKEQNLEQPEDPRITAAKIREEGADKREQARTELMMKKLDTDLDRDTAYNESMARRDETQAGSKREELMLRRELAMLDYANKHQITLDQIKSSLAQTAMKLRTTKELAAGKASADRLPKPPVEPPGKAPAGESYQK